MPTVPYDLTDPNFKKNYAKYRRELEDKPVDDFLREYPPCEYILAGRDVGEAAMRGRGWGGQQFLNCVVHDAMLSYLRGEDGQVIPKLLEIFREAVVNVISPSEFPEGFSERWRREPEKCMERLKHVFEKSRREIAEDEKTAWDRLPGAWFDLAVSHLKVDEWRLHPDETLAEGRERKACGRSNPLCDYAVLELGRFSHFEFALEDMYWDLRVKGDRLKCWYLKEALLECAVYIRGKEVERWVREGGSPFPDNTYALNFDRWLENAVGDMLADRESRVDPWESLAEAFRRQKEYCLRRAETWAPEYGYDLSYLDEAITCELIILASLMRDKEWTRKLLLPEQYVTWDEEEAYRANPVVCSAELTQTQVMKLYFIHHLERYFGQQGLLDHYRHYGKVGTCPTEVDPFDPKAEFKAKGKAEGLAFLRRLEGLEEAARRESLRRREIFRGYV